MIQKKKLVVLSGAGMSAESGIRTFRGSDGLWENYRIEEVASPQGWNRHRSLVLDFYNQRRKQIMESQPNSGHYALKALEKDYDVQIITQNIDNLHERAGSTHVLHLHGEIMKARSTADPTLVYELTQWQLNEGDTCALGSQLRPHIVWFGEEVPLLETAAAIVSEADIVVVIGTSLQVYPAAGLVAYAPAKAKKFVIDPIIPNVKHLEPITCIPEPASEGLQTLMNLLNSNSFK